MLMPQDSVGYPVPALRLRPGGGHQVPVGAVSARSRAFLADSRVVSVYATVPCFVATGGADVVATAGATEHYLPDGMLIYLSLGGRGVDTHLAVVRGAADGTLYVSELE